MKVLWFVNPPFPALQHHLGISFDGGGWWMSSLARALCGNPAVTLGVATTWSTLTSMVDFEADRVTYYAFPPGYKFLPYARGAILRGMRVVGSFLGAPDRRLLEHCLDVVRRFQPDVIHIHGSEDPWGLIAQKCKVPTVLSMQGVLNGYLPVYWGSSPLRWRLLMPSEGKYWLEWRLKRAQREREIFRVNRWFLGRTYWDQAWQKTLQPEGRYWNVGEIIRVEFHNTTWRLDHAERFTLYSTTSSAPLKGTDVLIRAVGLLRQRYPSVKLLIGGDLHRHGWGTYLRWLVRDLGLETQVSFLGYLDAPRIAEQLRGAHAFVLPSHVENSPNSLCEAQVVGVPCIASCVGGVSSLLEHGRTGLMFPRGDHVALASMVSSLFDDDQLASVLGAQARGVAQGRHAPEVIAQKLLQAYQDVIDITRG